MLMDVPYWPTADTLRLGPDKTSHPDSKTTRLKLKLKLRLEASSSRSATQETPRVEASSSTLDPQEIPKLEDSETSEPRGSKQQPSGLPLRDTNKKQKVRILSEFQIVTPEAGNAMARIALQERQSGVKNGEAHTQELTPQSRPADLKK